MSPKQGQLNVFGPHWQEKFMQMIEYQETTTTQTARQNFRLIEDRVIVVFVMLSGI